MRDAPNEAGIREHVLLFSRFLRNPRGVGAVTASSRTLARAMVAGLDLGGPGRVVELGPGTGRFTAAIIERLGTLMRFLAIDVDPAFVERIRQRWPSVECVCASAEHLGSLVAARGMLPIDHIVSGLPFVSLPAVMTRRILAGIASVLRSGGTFTTFQYVHAYWLPSAAAFRGGMSARLGGSPRVRLVVRNFPPAFVLTWVKR